MKAISKAFSIIFNILFYPILAVLMTVIVLFCFGIRPYITMSGSMEPAIHTGSVCFVNTKADYQDIHEGDIIAYELATGGLVTHRVITIDGDMMETKGDANEMSDGFAVTEGNFHGKTLFSIPKVGYALKTLSGMMKNPAYIAIAVVIVLAVFLVGRVDRFYEKKEAKEEAESAPQQSEGAENISPETPENNS